MKKIIVLLVFILSLAGCSVTNANKFQVTFDTLGGSDVPSLQVEEGDYFEEPQTPTYVGYTFRGWYTDTGLDSPFDSSLLVTEDITLYAKWDINSYTITYYDYDNSVLQLEEFDFNEFTELNKSTPTRTGYTFKEWDAVIPETMPANDITVTALYDINSYSITYLDYHGAVLENYLFEFGSDLSLILVDEPNLEGCTFGGWSIDLPNTMPANDLIITAIDIYNFAPFISVENDIVIIENEEFDVMEGVTAFDAEDGDLSNNIIIIENNLDVTVEGSYTITYQVTDKDGGVNTVTRRIIVEPDDHIEVITIMHPSVHTVDPFHPNYSGDDQLEKQTKQREIEALYNVEIQYVSYPTYAAWGPSRVTAIVQSSLTENHLADIYFSMSHWTQDLVDGRAIIDISPYMDEHGQNIDESYIDLTTYKDGIYGFDTGKVVTANGLYFNEDLLKSLGVQNPVELYLSGDWNWTIFEEWATSLQTAMASLEDHYPLGGMLSIYAENMVPLNGGRVIGNENGLVGFTQVPALETYEFLTTLYNEGLFEPDPAYDAGSRDWQSGKVGMYPGDLWYLTSNNRWGGLSFEVGYVPYPIADDFTGEYTSPIQYEEVYSIASGMTLQREELVFQVWNELQLWKTEQEITEVVQQDLSTYFSNELYIQAYLEVYTKVHIDLLWSLDIQPYTQGGWVININKSIVAGTSAAVMEMIKDEYEEALSEYFR